MSKDILATGITELDKALGGGFRRRTLNVVAAGVMRGSSSIMKKISEGYSKNNLRGVIFDIEGSFFNHIPNTMITSEEYSEDRVRNFEFKKSRLVDKIVKECNGSQSLGKPDFDYLCIDESWKRHNYAELQILAHDLDIPIITTVRLARKTNAPLSITYNNISFNMVLMSHTAIVSKKVVKGIAHCELVKSIYSKQGLFNITL